MASYASSIFDALSFGAGLASLYRGEKLHKSTLEHDKELHVRGIASSTEQHFQELCAELLTAAKEADRDVWEQRNGQFNNLMLSSTLMFGVAVASIVEGNFNQTVDGHATAWFACFVACALSFLFVSLVCCMLVSRRMSIYMIMRSSRFVSWSARSKVPPWWCHIWLSRQPGAHGFGPGCSRVQEARLSRSGRSGSSLCVF